MGTVARFVLSGNDLCTSTGLVGSAWVLSVRSFFSWGSLLCSHNYGIPLSFILVYAVIFFSFLYQSFMIGEMIHCDVSCLHFLSSLSGFCDAEDVLLRRDRLHHFALVQK